MFIDKMEYGTERIRKVIATGCHKGHQYVVMSQGTHPCCYVAFPNGKAVNTDLIDCHGGVTYTKDHLPGDTPISGVYWIGWDYAHTGDWIWFDPWGKKWTTEELEAECIAAIDSVEG